MTVASVSTLELFDRVGVYKLRLGNNIKNLFSLSILDFGEGLLRIEFDSVVRRLQFSECLKKRTKNFFILKTQH